jgi:preprotein translocase subunit SecD
VAEAYPIIDRWDKPAIAIRFTQDAQEKARRLSQERRDKRLAILVGGQVICAPVIREDFSELAQINGEFTLRQVKEIADLIKKQ